MTFRAGIQKVSVCAILASTIVLWGEVLFAQALSFLPPASAWVSGYAHYAADMCNSCLATADFNGDGKVDIVYSAGTYEGLSAAGVLLGNGDGTFRPAASFPADVSQSAFFVADFNGDGKADVAFSVGSRIYLGDGTGNFSAPVTVPACATGETPPGISAIGDFDGDGKADLICGTSVLLNNGDGTFRTVPGTLDGQAVLVADFNRDAKPDVLVTLATGELAVVLGRGNGTFGPGIPILDSTNLQTVRTGDFNDDSRIDLAALSADGTAIIVLPGRGDGTFGPAIITTGAPGPITAVADFNRDGKQDLAAGDAVLAGNGDGTFRYPVFLGVVTQTCDPRQFVACDYRRAATAVADFNGDGLPDIAAGYVVEGLTPNRAASVSILLNDGPGDGFAATGLSSATWNWPVGPGSLVSAFGVNLAPRTEATTTSPAPTTLGGIRVHLRDRSHPDDRLAPLLFVSPTQINFVVTSPSLPFPPDLEIPAPDTYVWVTIEPVGFPYVPKGMAIPIQTLAPGLFALDSGLAAATAVRIAPDGTQTPVSVSEPIDISGDPVYLSLYGTGFSRASTANSNCTIGGQALPATYAGPQMQIAGLDQINVILPRTLAGTGNTSITCKFGLSQPVSVGNDASNAVKLNFQ